MDSIALCNINNNQDFTLKKYSYRTHLFKENRQLSKQISDNNIDIIIVLSFFKLNLVSIFHSFFLFVRNILFLFFFFCQIPFNKKS